MMSWVVMISFFFNDTATTEIYTLSPTRRSSDLRVLLHLQRGGRHAAGVGGLAGGERDAGVAEDVDRVRRGRHVGDRKSTRLNSSHANISYAVFCLKKKNTVNRQTFNSHMTLLAF